MRQHLGRIFIAILTACLLCLAFANQIYAASTVTNNKKYKARNVAIQYKTFTVKTDDNKSLKMANLYVTWTNGTNKSDKTVELYLDDADDCFYSEDVGSEYSSLVIREAVLGMEPCRIRAVVYPKRTGRGDSDIYVSSSNSYSISKEKLERLGEFDEDYFGIEAPWITYNTETHHVIVQWDEYTDVKQRMYCIKRGSTVVSTWKSGSSKSADLSDIIAQKGAGTYTVGVFAVALGEQSAQYSEEFEVDSTMAKEVKKQVADEQAAIEAGRIGWYNSSGLAWYYYKDYGVKAKNEWLDIDGNTYHFTSAGIMQTGWQVIDEKWFYFGTDGALKRNTSTPDGYLTNADGARIDASGNIVSAKGQKQLPATITQLKTCQISLTESGKEPGVVKEVSIKDGTGYTILSQSFGAPYEDWKPGQYVEVTLQVEAKPNYYFDSAVKFTTRGSSVSSTGNSKVRTVHFLYYPKVQLKSPTYLHVNSDGQLVWKKVDNAKVYKITLESEDYEKTITETVDTNSFDLSGYITSTPVGPKLKIYAVHSKNSKANTYYLNSPTVEIADINIFANDTTIEGTVTWSGSKPRYINEEGEPVTGWAQLFDNWYFFDSKGYAHEPGWFRHIDGYWYYFDEECRMCTGTITDGTATYFLNDGSDKSLPLGAWVQ